MVVLANIVIFSFGAFFLIDLLRSLPEPLGAYGVGALLLAVYAGLIWFCSRYPDLEMDDPSAPALSLPVPGPTIKSGLHFLLPVVLLIWCLMVERMSPSLSAYWAVVFMIFILLTQRPLFAFFRRHQIGSASGRERGCQYV